MLPNLLSLHLTVLTCTMHALSGPLGCTLMVRECSGLVHPEQSSPHHHHAKFGGFETLYDIVWAYVGDPKLKGLLMPPSWVWRLVNHWEPIPPLTMPILWSLCQTVSTLVGIPRSLTLEFGAWWTPWKLFIYPVWSPCKILWLYVWVPAWSTHKNFPPLLAYHDKFALSRSNGMSTHRVSIQRFGLLWIYLSSSVKVLWHLSLFSTNAETLVEKCKFSDLTCN